jgi:hypothetical protein
VGKELTILALLILCCRHGGKKYSGKDDSGDLVFCLVVDGNHVALLVVAKPN